MSVKVLDNIFSFFKEYAEYCKSVNTYPYEIQKISKNKKDEYIVSVKITHKNSIFYTTAVDLVNKDSLLKRFLWCDIRTICYYAFVDHMSPRYKVLSMSLDITPTGKVVLKERGKRKKVKRTLGEIINDEEILSSIPPESTVKIGFLTDNSIKKEDIKNKKRLFKKINFLNKKYRQLHQRKIEKFFMDSDEEYSAHIIFNGSKYDIKALALVNDDLLIKVLPWYDIRNICYYAFVDQNTPKVQLISSSFNFSEDGRIKLKVKGKRVFSKNIHETVNDNKIINSIPSLDAFKLGRFSANTEKLEIELEKKRLTLVC